MSEQASNKQKIESKQYALHPLCTLFPRMSGEDYEALREDISANGLQQPIVLHQEMILDGGNRYRACLDLDIEPIFVEFGGDNLASFVISANLRRRHLTPGQQAAIVASAQDWAQAHPGGSGGDRRSSATLHLDSAASRATESGASLRTQKMADQVAKADPELAKKVAHGEISLPKAAEQVSGKSQKPAKKKTSTAPDAALRAELETANARISELESINAELLSQYEEIVAENVSLQAVTESDDQVAAALAEAKKFRELNRIAEERIRGLMNEKNTAIQMVKSLQRKLKAAGVA